ncbi:MAG: hypothetical protein AAGU75_02205 [Bacillota bacterium]
MESFDEKLEELANIFSSTLKKFDEETETSVLGVLASQNCLEDEFKKASMNIKVAC